MTDTDGGLPAASGEQSPTVRVLSCGGTIASEPTDAGAKPAKSGDELVSAVPELADYADVSAVEVAAHPGFDMQFSAVAGVVEAIHEGIEAGVDGFVVTHGTDTLADTAYALWLTLDPARLGDRPVVVTGAQRRFDEPSSDAPANLTTAVRAATGEAAGSGVFVAFDDELHAARDAVKTHTNKLDTFQSPDKGPVASFTRADSRVHRRVAPAEGGPYADAGSLAASAPSADAGSLSASAPSADAGSLSESAPSADSGSLSESALSADAEVAVVHSGLGVGAGGIDRALAAGVDGIVVEGTGLGNVTGALGDAIREAVESVPVVVASRCHAGPTEPVYGTTGGAVTLRERGVHFAGDLPTAKARVKLCLALSAGVEGDALGALFE
jgi:L-asparaginase